MLKGITKIELTDVKTGKVETYQKHNMVSNAVTDILGLNPAGFKTKADYNSVYFPIVPQLLGGILLVKDPLVANPAQYYVPNDNEIIGYACNNVNTSNDVKRGSFNETESGLQDDGKSYKFVFDFATHQGNGNISAIGLTSAQGGYDGFGNKFTTYKGIKMVSNLTYNYPYNATAATWQAYWARSLRMDHIVRLDIENNRAIVAYAKANKTIEIATIPISLSAFNLTENPATLECARAYNIVATLTTTTFGATVSNSYSYHTFLDDEEGYIWGFEHSGNTSGNSSDVATVNWIKISLADYSFEEGTWSISASLLNFGYLYNGLTTSPTYNYYHGTNAIIHKGYLYSINYSKTGIYRISLSDPTDVLFMPHPDGTVILSGGYTSSTSGNNSYPCFTSFNKIYDTIYFHNGYIEGDKIVPTAYTADNSPSSNYPLGLEGFSKPGLRVGPFLFGFSHYYYYHSTATNRDLYGHRMIALLGTYLGTINNLETPIVKTPDKTMKITYTISAE